MKSVAAECRKPARPVDGGCELCRRATPLEFHHLIPRRNHRRAWFRANFAMAEMRSRGVWICRGCHDFIHDHFDENTLGRQFNTLAALADEPSVARHLAWASRQGAGARRS